jgi:hypothetical protein
MLLRYLMTIPRLFRLVANGSALDYASSAFRRLRWPFRGASLFRALVFVFSSQIAIGIYAQTAGENKSNAQTPAPNTATLGISTPSTTLNPVWEKEFKASVTKEQRRAWSKEKLEAYDDWLEQEGNRLDMENQKLDERIKSLDVANQKLARDNAILAEMAGKLKQLSK